MSKAKKIYNTVVIALMALVMILAILLVGVRLFGIQPFVVISGSMEPTYHVGAMVYVREADATELVEGDVITFTLHGGAVATHRIIEVIEDEENPALRCFRTKGDANDDPDGNLVLPREIIGKVIFSIPLLGYVAEYVQQPPGRYVALGACMALLVAIFMFDLVKAVLVVLRGEGTSEEQGHDPDDQT